ncbi:unnamed protein product [Amoebophrya sp. A120]|nr:unnamed protein product [Amoebophrya sp. A120]|eukprot:GSA120T00021496001.1
MPTVLDAVSPGVTAPSSGAAKDGDPVAPLEDATEQLLEEAAAAPEDVVEETTTDDMMELLDLLADAKRGRNLEEVAGVLDQIGRLAFAKEGEREAVCDFDGITGMCEVVREPHMYLDEGELTAAEAKFIDEFTKKKNLIADDDEEVKTAAASEPLNAIPEDTTATTKPVNPSSLDEYKEPVSSELIPHLTPESAFDVKYRKAMIAFCQSLKGVCHRSNLNRGALRDEGAVEEVVGFVEATFHCLASPTDGKPVSGERKELLERCIAAGCCGLKALCQGNDGNKKLAARIAGKFNAEGLAATDCLDPTVPTMAKTTDKTGKAIDLLLEILEYLSESAKVQTQGIWALRSIVTDDDSRGGESMVPSAVENRDYVCDRERFPRVREIIVRSFRSMKQSIDDNLEKENLGGEQTAHNATSSSSSAELPEQPKKSPMSPDQWYRLEGVLLLMKEVGCHQERIHKFVFEDNVLPLIKDTLSYGHQSIVRACLFVLRQFAFSDHMKDLFTNTDAEITKTATDLMRSQKNTDNTDAEITKTAMLVLRKYTKCTAIVEQAFGLFSNLTLRKPQICETLNADPMRIAAMGLLVLAEYQNNASVVTTVLFTLRNVAKAVPEAAKEMEDSGLFELIRKIYFQREADMHRQWLAAKDIGKQFLREFREDTDGMRRPITHNDYY